MTDPDTGTSGGWAYVSLVSAVPGLSPDNRSAITVQFAVFEGTALILAAIYDLWELLPLATTAIIISTLGSYLMVDLSDRIHSLNPSKTYRRLLFDSSLDILMGLVAFITLLTYLIIDVSSPGNGLLERLVGDPLPPSVVFFALFVAWDLTYRIGIGWWTSITGLWRTIILRTASTDQPINRYTRADLITILFAGLQLLLIPFLWSDRVLTFLILGHVLAVVVVSSLAIGLQIHQ